MHPYNAESSTLRWNSLCIKLLVLLSLLFLFKFPLQAETEVKIGYFLDGDYMYKSDDGSYRGYNVEYLYEIARYTDWKYTFVDFDSFEEECKALEKGEIDIMPAIFFTEEREKLFNYSKADMGRLYVTIVVPETDAAHTYNDYESLDGIKIGVLEGTEDAKQVEAWCKEKKIKPNFIYFNSNDEMLFALDTGMINAVGETYMGASSKYRVVAEFSPMFMYFTVTKKNPEILSQLDYAMDMIAIDNPNFQYALIQKYFSVGAGQKPVFSEKEKEFVAKKQIIKVAVQIDNPPYGYYAKNKEIHGVVRDLFDSISETSGLQFAYVPAGTSADAMALVKNGKVDVIAKCLNDSILAVSYNSVLTNPYLTVTLSQISKKSTRAIHVVAVTGFVEPFYNEKEKYAEGKYEVRFLPGSKQCFDALKKGEVDAAVIGSAVANYFINMNRASDYTINEMSGYEFNISAGVRRSAPTELYSIINKCVNHTGVSLMNDFLLKHSVADVDTFHAFINKIPLGVMAVLSLILGLLVIMLIVIITFMVNRSDEENKLRLAKKENEIKNEFMGTMSHDMRTPLNAVLGYAHIAKGTKEPTKKDECLDKITDAGNLLLNLVNSTLLISKVENKKFELHPEPTDCTEMLQEVLVSISAVAAKKNITFNVDCTNEHFGLINVDKLNLQKIFLNLLSNAVNYTEEGGTVSFTFEELTEPRNDMNAKAVITDTGIGMSKPFLEKMYDPFTQELTKKNLNGAGAGLGLSIVKHLIDMMHGTIDVKSELGKGTEFTVYLPLETSFNSKNVELLFDATPLSVPEQKLNEAVSGKRVLLCEDNDMNREIATALFEEKHVLVDTATNGAEGVEKFILSAKDTYDVIFMDIRMPEMDGYEATKAIRSSAHAQAQTIPIIAITADAYEDDIQKCIAAGMNAHVAKPIEQEMLFATMYKVITSTRS